MLAIENLASVTRLLKAAVNAFEGQTWVSGLCQACGQPYAQKRRDQRYCSARCRQVAHRRQAIAFPS